MNSVKLSWLTIPEIELIESHANFTKDELDVFRMRCKGYGTIEIAQRLNMSTRTIERKYERIMNKIVSVNHSGVPIENKILLTITEASALSGLLPEKIEEMIEKEKYKSMLLICDDEIKIKRNRFQNILETEERI